MKFGEPEFGPRWKHGSDPPTHVGR